LNHPAASSASVSDSTARDGLRSAANWYRSLDHPLRSEAATVTLAADAPTNRAVAVDGSLGGPH